MQDISIIRIFRYALAVIIVLTIAAYSNPANAQVLYSESFGFTGTNSLANIPSSGSVVIASTNISGHIDRVWVDFDDGKVIDRIQAGNGSVALFTGGALLTPKLSSALNGVNSNLTSFSAYVDGTYYGSGVIGWQRNPNNNYTYVIDFNSVNTAFANTLSLKKGVWLNYDPTVFTGITASTTDTGVVNSSFNYAAIEVSIDSGGFGQRVAVYVFRDTTISFAFTDTATVEANNISGTYAYINLTKSSVNYGFNISNATGYEFYGLTSTSDVSQLLDYTGGISFNLHHISLDVWANRTIFDASGNVFVPPAPPTPGEGGSISGQITYNFNNASIGNTYGINANITNANFTAFTTYYIYAYDAFDNVVTGFPISFSTQNYSTGKFWTFNVSGNYNATLKYCGILECILGTRHDLDTASVFIPPASYAFSVTADQANYQPGNTINIVATNPSPNPAYLTAFGETGIITDIAWNTLIPAGQSVGLSKVIPQNMPLGTYTLNLATTTSYYPIVAQAVFNISSPGNTTNTLSALWGESIYLLGNVGTVTTTSNWNASTLTITSPAGVTTSFLFPANSTNYTLITLDIAGQWNARIVDDNNASRFSQSNTTVTTGNPTDNQTIAQCMSASTYICWDKRQYTQGQAYTISFRQVPKLTDFLNPYIEITNPSGTVIYNQTVNGTWNANAGIYSGSISGNFDPQASTGVYFARLKNKNLLGGTEIEAESATEVIAGATPTTTEGQVSTTTATGLLNVLGIIAFYGLAIYVGLLYGLIKLMTRNGGQIDSAGFIYAAVILANVVALIGLFDPFKMYVLVLTWIIAGANFMLGRRTVTGGQ